MSAIELLQRAGLAVAIGLLIGIERGWQDREVQDGGRVAGIRTFTLISLLGAVSGLTGSAVALGFCFVGFALPFGLFEWRHARITRSRSATDLIAGFLTFWLGAYAAQGSMVLAAAAGVTATAILAERRMMHTFLQRLQWVELRAAIALLVMTVVLLPLLPDRFVDPWGAINPYQIWLMTVLIGIVCYAGYIAIRFAGERKGLLYAGLMGGLITSTTVTWTFARMAKRNPEAFPAVLAAILGAWIVSLLRTGLLAVSIAPQLASELLPPLGVAAIILLLPALVSYFRSTRSKAASAGMVLRDPLELALMLKFAVLLTVVTLLAKWVRAASGDIGLISFGGLSGLLDVDPITLSTANLARGSLAPSLAAATILTAAVANGAAKAVLAGAFGGLRFGLILTGIWAASVAGGILMFFF